MRVLVAILIAYLCCNLVDPGHGQTCSADDFGKAVDEAGAALRSFNAENAPRLQGKLRQLRTKHGWSETEFEAKSVDILHDARVEELDRQANDILARIDSLGATTQGKPDCSRLGDLQAASSELLATMRAKSAYMIGRIDALLEDRPQAAVPSALPKAAPRSKSAPPPSKAANVDPGRPRDPTPSWATTTQTETTPQGASGPVVADAQPVRPVPAPTDVDDGYTIDEIREATRGFFGQVSTGLASVIEYAFKSAGRPTAYVLGQEGGGAFLAGLRYGDGTLYLRAGGTQRVWWHGPSIGYDVGAAGSRTMFLIYRLRRPEELFRRFTGVDGSAYLVGGVGITFLTNGDVVMAPIRSGVGLRLGASIGYVRFSPTPTWNPF